jgi:hypothetical protein
VSTVRLLILEKEVMSGSMYSCNADSMSHEDGFAEGEKREKVRWYVGAYLKDLVVCRAIFSVTSGDSDLILDDCIAVFVDSRYANVACSSENIACNSFARNVAKGADVDVADGTWFGA